jgi:Ser/Thr protein kinase RdoA (MazF antagonist)
VVRFQQHENLVGLAELAAQYGLDVASAKRHSHKVVRLDTGSGSFALRRYNPGLSRVQVEAIQTTVTILAGEGCPVVAPLSTLEGTTLVDWEHCFAELLPWIEHTDDGHTWNNLVLAMPALRVMHDTLALLALETDQRDDPWKSPGLLREQLQCDRLSIDQLAHNQNIDISRLLAKADSMLEMLERDGRLDAAPRQLTHGDVQGANLLFDGGALVGVIEFERLEARPRLYDLAWPLVFWRWYGTDDGDYTEYDWQMARACCAAYAQASARPIDRETWATLPLLMAYIPVRGIADAGLETDPVAEIVAFAKALDFAEWVVRHPGEACARLGVR